MTQPTLGELRAQLATILTRLLAAAERVRWPLARRSTVDQLQTNLTLTREALKVALQMDQDRRERALSLVDIPRITPPAIGPVEIPLLNLEPVEAPPVTLPTGSRPCRDCGQPMPFGVAHYCATEPVPARRVA